MRKHMVNGYNQFIDKFNNELIPLYQSKSYYNAMPLHDSRFTDKAYNEIGILGLMNIMTLIKNSEVKYVPNVQLCIIAYFCLWNVQTF